MKVCSDTVSTLLNPWSSFFRRLRRSCRGLAIHFFQLHLDGLLHPGLQGRELFCGFCAHRKQDFMAKTDGSRKITIKWVWFFCSFIRIFGGGWLIFSPLKMCWSFLTFWHSTSWNPWKRTLPPWKGKTSASPLLSIRPHTRSEQPIGRPILLCVCVWGGGFKL